LNGWDWRGHSVTCLCALFYLDFKTLRKRSEKLQWSAYSASFCVSISLKDGCAERGRNLLVAFSYLVLVGAGHDVYLLLLHLLLTHRPLPHAHCDLVVRQGVTVLTNQSERVKDKTADMTAHPVPVY
jgi:hypothetical protein